MLLLFYGVLTFTSINDWLSERAFPKSPKFGGVEGVSTL